MRNTLLIAKREYFGQVRGRAFRFSTILVPLLMIFLLGVTTLTGRKMATGRHVVVIADSPALADDIRTNLLADRAAQYTVDTIAPYTDADRVISLAHIQDKSIDGVLTIEHSTSAKPEITYYSESSSDLMYTSGLSTAVNDGFLHLRLMQQGLTQQQVKSLFKPVSLQTLQVAGNGKTSEGQGSSPFFKAMMMTFLMTMPIILYGFDTARSIVEEKSSRIFEVMLAIARPEEMLAGKLLGVGAVGLTQIAIWISAALILGSTTLAGPLLSGQIKVHFSVAEAVLFPIYFVLGFFLYSAFFSGLAATCETASDLQMYLFLGIIPTWSSFAILPFLLNNPNSPWVVALSMFPPIAPMLMVPRIGMMPGQFPYWQVALSITLLLLSIWAMVWFGSRLYRIGILMYGKRATLPELLRWLRSA